MMIIIFKLVQLGLAEVDADPLELGHRLSLSWCRCNWRKESGKRKEKGLEDWSCLKGWNDLQSLLWRARHHPLQDLQGLIVLSPLKIQERMELLLLVFVLQMLVKAAKRKEVEDGRGRAMLVDHHQI